MALAAGGGHGGAHGVIQTRLEVDSVVGLTSGLQLGARKSELSNSTGRRVGRKRSARALGVPSSKRLFGGGHPRSSKSRTKALLSEKRKLILRKQTPAYTQAEHTQRTAKA